VFHSNSASPTSLINNDKQVVQSNSKSVSFNWIQ